MWREVYEDGDHHVSHDDYHDHRKDRHDHFHSNFGYHDGRPW